MTGGRVKEEAMSDRLRKASGRLRHRRARLRQWWGSVTHVPHPRAVWCGSMWCPYAKEAER